MKLYESLIFNCINAGVERIQNRLDTFKQNSVFLSHLDIFIIILLILTLIVSAFASTNPIGVVSVFVPIFVILNTFITKGETIELEQCNFYILIYLFICFISNFTSSMPYESFYGFIKTFVYIMFYFSLCQFFKNNQKYISVVFITVAALISLECIAGMVQNSMKLENISTWQDTSYLNPEDVLTRVYGTLKPYNPNLFAGFLIAGFPSLFYVCAVSLKNKKYLPSVVSFVFIILCMLTIFLTGCRGAYIALFAIIIGSIIASFNIIFNDIKINELKRIWKCLLGFFCVSVMGFLFFNHGIMKRIMSIFMMRADSSASFRMNVYNSALQMFQDNWLFGIGAGNKVFREIYGLYMLSGFDALSCYCIYLEMAVESGIFSLISYLLFAGILFFNSIKQFFKIKDYNKKVIIFTAFISMLAVLIHGLVDTIYFRPQVQYLFWTMAAILTVSIRREK